MRIVSTLLVAIPIAVLLFSSSVLPPFVDAILAVMFGLGVFLLPIWKR